MYFSSLTIHCCIQRAATIREALGVYCLKGLWCMSYWEKKKKCFTWMSSDSHRFWEHTTFQMCTFQLFLLSDRKGGDTLILKKKKKIRRATNEFSFPILCFASDRMGHFVTAAYWLWSSSLRLSLYFQKWKKIITIEKQQQDTAESYACCCMVLRMRKGKGKVKKEAKH